MDNFPINNPIIEQIWQLPPEPINQILDAPSLPTIVLSPNREWMVELDRPLLVPISSLAEMEVPLAGLLINPKTNAPVHANPFQTMKVRRFPFLEKSKTVVLPDNAQIDYLKWSPDSRKLAFTLTQPTGLELWFVDVEDFIPKQLTQPVLNGAYGEPFHWLSNETLICKFILTERPEAPCEPTVPPGPLIQENLKGKSPTRTYTHLLQNPHNEALLEYYLTSTLETVTLDGQRTLLVSNRLIHEAIPSPDSKFILMKTLHRPFSYQVPISYFPKKIEVIDELGKCVYEVADLPLFIPRTTKFNEVRKGRRAVFWRTDVNATLFWLEALDGGDPTHDVPKRDALFELDAPFTNTPKQLWQSEYRLSNLAWGKQDVALVWERWYDNRKQRIWRIYPQAPETPPQLLFDRSYEDKYTDPGSALMTVGPYNYKVLRFAPQGNIIYLKGRGASSNGAYPFLDCLNLETGEKQRLWQSQDPYFEEIAYVLDDEAQTVITRRQSRTEPPNYFLLNRHNNQSPFQLTDYQDPAPQLAGVYTELVKYQRADGVQLSAKLYLPPGYDAERDGPVPMLFWVYPEEFKDKEFAGQITESQNNFSRPLRASVLFLLTQGYGILSGPSLPIIGEGETEPNDTYVEQLIAGAQAAVDYVVERGIGDRNRIGIAGHSYGAFTTVNLLAHTNLFCTGIARSGAYNRTLTPFGFQGEQRNFWEAQQTYIHMSPFTHLEKVKAPLLLIHGKKDSNSGTYPLQTERLYEALKGLGAIVRLVILPLEDHSYRSREGVAHVLWEMSNWCDRYLK
ncbi:prolyl oligopeptidase family serine peptidase [Aetokthonos hydrillicola Thurmond2011]|jgi:dipeptidyl aminopeptidase/acylaminoacyl peptidase|uniref:Prolyl oligopeptidase family serine peptidase n=1 Tax=Aetokthonos hydrillicola Thurmond2011 TaxID=2712845 RepID=A0AAP5MAI2_9CYAN|nr:prolyl oligopeptidase family serine peptidase [Aetokthonos hydrillicola]MBO3460416.1 S9 family peptidase [Aetokthonos hydrillicola CCALA 1050]MBW4588508.1 prolyl oligopeptidase family serine peptidase [Aetokthonos hydrillicola CCALA 1050]MDR9896837.1 prolyl oligopeptidase family serine peptidase [Aetokthonos hydrillicola Thurmond2011]